jgi:hypothetical protein
MAAYGERSGHHLCSIRAVVFLSAAQHGSGKEAFPRLPWTIVLATGDIFLTGGRTSLII